MLALQNFRVVALSQKLSLAPSSVFTLKNFKPLFTTIWVFLGEGLCGAEEVRHSGAHHRVWPTNVNYDQSEQRRQVKESPGQRRNSGASFLFILFGRIANGKQCRQVEESAGKRRHSGASFLFILYGRISLMANVLKTLPFLESCCSKCVLG